MSVFLYSSYVLAQYLRHKSKNKRVTDLGKEALRLRNSKKYDFSNEVSKLDVKHIVDLDVQGLRRGLLNADFTSVDLVHVFADRSYKIGRELCLSAQENFEEALIMAK